MASLVLILLLAPLIGSAIVGLGCRVVSKANAHRITIALMSVSFIAAIAIFIQAVSTGQTYQGNFYTWIHSGIYHFTAGYLIDKFSAVMVVIVTFIALVVHVYSIGYMRTDSGYQRFFSYMSLFTFAMLTLVVANNFLQLFFGWEGVGLVSYLLIGFWFNTQAADKGSLKAFIVNRIGDMGFILGIAAILEYFDSLNYETVFSKVQAVSAMTITVIPNHPWPILTVICILLFIGAMGKSAQIPLHVWLPESMAGPTPISALIHAATMVTAGIYMVARMSPLYEYSPTALSLVLIIGATGGLFLGLLAFVENDIKRVIAYSTLSQLGYMMAANGASAYSAAIFLLLTHACFKALLFLAAGSVIIAMHHEQDIRKMGNLRQYLPITFVTFLIGALALAAIPPFSGFFAKDAVIEAVWRAPIFGAGYAGICLLIGSFVTAYYIFRAFFLVFYGKEHVPSKVKAHLHEPGWVITGPLIVLAIPSALLGMLLVYSMLYAPTTLLGHSVVVLPKYDVLKEMATDYHGILYEIGKGFFHPTLWLALLGIFTAWVLCVVRPHWREKLAHALPRLYRILVAKYGFDAFNQKVIVRFTLACSEFFYHKADVKFLDSILVDGAGREISRLSSLLRRLQTGYIYHYALVMIVGLLGLLCWRLYF